VFEFESPIEVAVNANRLFMEGLQAVLDLRLRNVSPDETFRASLTVLSRVLPKPVHRDVHLPGGAQRRRRLELSLPRGTADGPGSAGETRFEIALVVDAGKEGRHRFYGEFALGVLAYSENCHSVNVSIGKLIEQHGDKAGMGAINEVDLSNFVKLPDSVSVNDLLQRQRDARFVPIELEYEGPVEEDTALLDADAPPLFRCSLVPRQKGPRILVLTGDSITLGRSRKDCDIVTWILPRSDENDHASRMISGRHVRLERTPDGVRIRPLSMTNATLIGGKRLAPEGTTVRNAATVSRASRFEFAIQPLPVSTGQLPIAPEASASHAWDDARRARIGGALITRQDGFAEREAYIWVWSDVAAPLGESRDSNCRLLSLPRLAVVVEPAQGRSRALSDATEVVVAGRRWHVEGYQQDLELHDDPSFDETIER